MFSFISRNAKKAATSVSNAASSTTTYVKEACVTAVEPVTTFFQDEYIVPTLIQSDMPGCARELEIAFKGLYGIDVDLKIPADMPSMKEGLYPSPFHQQLNKLLFQSSLIKVDTNEEIERLKGLGAAYMDKAAAREAKQAERRAAAGVPVSEEVAPIAQTVKEVVSLVEKTLSTPDGKLEIDMTPNMPIVKVRVSESNPISVVELKMPPTAPSENGLRKIKIFQTRWEAITKEVPYKANWANGTGYLDRLVYDNKLKNSMGKNTYAKFTMPDGRRGIVIKNSSSLLVVFERDIERPGVFVVNGEDAFRSREIYPHLSSDLSAETMLKVLGDNATDSVLFTKL